MRTLLKVLLILFLTTNVYAALPPTRILDEGTDKGVFFKLDCVGAGITCTQSGITGTLSVSGGGAGLAEGDIDTSAELDAIINDNTGSGMIVFNDTAIMTSLTVNTSLTLGAAGILSDNSIDSDDFVHEDWGEVTNASGSVVIDDGITVDTWVLGDSTATTINKVTITAPASAATLTIADGKTLTATNTVNLNTMTDGKWCSYTAAGTVLNCAENAPGASTDDQTIDVLSFSDPNLSVSLEDDGEASQTVDISGLNIDPDNLDDEDQGDVNISSDTWTVQAVGSETFTTADAGTDAFLGFDDTADAYENLSAAEALAIIGGEANDFDASGDVTNDSHTHAIDNIQAPSGATSIDFGTQIITLNDGKTTSHDFFTIKNDLADPGNTMYLLELQYKDADDNDADFLKCTDGEGADTKLEITYDGSIITDGTITGTTSLTIGSAALEEAELEKLDGITNGTGAANKAVVLDASLDIDLGTGDLLCTELDVSGNITNATIDPDLLSDEDQGDVNIDSDTWKVEEVQSGAISEAADIDNDIITNAQIADADQTDTKCFKYIESDGIDDADDFVSVWHNGTANAFLITSFWCETDADTVTGMLQVDDGAPADIEAVDIVCDTDEQQELAPDGDCEIAAGEELDWATTSQTGSTVLTVCWTGNWVD